MALVGGFGLHEDMVPKPLDGRAAGGLMPLRGQEVGMGAPVPITMPGRGKRARVAWLNCSLVGANGGRLSLFGPIGMFWLGQAGIPGRAGGAGERSDPVSSL